MKSIAGSAELVEWCINTSEELQLEPRPPILGFVPSMYDERRAIHKTYLQQLPTIAKELEIKVYPRIRDSSEFKNASANGLPLQKHRPAHAACNDFKEITNDLSNLISKEKRNNNGFAKN
jgi:chromosome partitioning protein